MALSQTCHPSVRWEDVLDLVSTAPGFCQIALLTICLLLAQIIFVLPNVYPVTYETLNYAVSHATLRPAYRPSCALQWL